MSFEIVNPESLGAPKGFSHGMLAPPGGRVLFVAGQTATDETGALIEGGLVEQFERALERVVTVVRESGGGPEDIGRMTLYVTDLDAYRSNLGPLGAAYRRVMGRHYPAMALLEVRDLMDEGAVVEIEATAILGDTGTGERDANR